MTALTKYFFDTVYFPRSAWAVVRWWEARRGVYNLAVGGAGLLTLAGVAVFATLPPAGVLAALVAVYAVLANACYSLGAVADLASRRFGGPAFAPIGPALLRYGFVFSVGLTLFPVAIAALAWAVQLVGVFHVASGG